jgi:hypothetical protein
MTAKAPEPSNAAFRIMEFPLSWGAYTSKSRTPERPERSVVNLTITP